MRTETITYLKKHAADLPVEDSPLTITQNGTPAYVIESARDYEKRQETVALLKLLALSAQDKIKGRVSTDTEFEAHIEKRKKALKS
ncbi:MAG: type II toxin-antitoxin system Phd/YefM family antitoxin [Psychrosphaera sp.]|nr:type II toxin-antitoxin system Phd/YefM family antitoxin [Psychrosphaera sp.]